MLGDLEIEKTLKTYHTHICCISGWNCSLQKKVTKVIVVNTYSEITCLRLIRKNSKYIFGKLLIKFNTAEI